jgi:hypothetical protein
MWIEKKKNWGKKLNEFEKYKRKKKSEIEQLLV